jgi:hypothetical protein
VDVGIDPGDLADSTEYPQVDLIPSFLPFVCLTGVTIEGSYFLTTSRGF